MKSTKATQLTENRFTIGRMLKKEEFLMVQDRSYLLIAQMLSLKTKNAVV